MVGHRLLPGPRPALPGPRPIQGMVPLVLLIGLEGLAHQGLQVVPARLGHKEAGGGGREHRVASRTVGPRLSSPPPPDTRPSLGSLKILLI